MPVVSITLTKKEIAILTARAKKEQRTASSLIREAIESYLKTSETGQEPLKQPK